MRGNKQEVKLRNSQRQECIQKVLTVVITNVYSVFTWCLIYFCKIFIYHLIWNGTQFFLQPISFSPLSVIGLHYCSVGKIIGFVIGLLIPVASSPSHHHFRLARIIVTSFANSYPPSQLFNVLLGKRAFEPIQNKEISELK